ncbi:MAG: hypothetical protein LUH49_03925 [Cloacibacillus porcorum]|uniref:hypothetical protein n=1 Tax=Cloacibacillus porcorum TaxID=1197717 RepID=UPI0023EFD170|nr:hypothetical protein [Cloacibacillus porcorum]MCD7876110.1 hypothetical protein [Cloacibacillus porcorum]
MVQDAFLSSISALNMVGDIATKNGIQNNTVLIDPTHTLKPSTVEVVEGISVIDSPYYLDIFTAEYFEQSIVGKYVFCSLMYYGGCLPINQKARFKIQDTPELIKDPDVNYKPLLFTTEKTIGDLYKNAFAYQYNIDADAFLRLPDAAIPLNKLKFYMQKRVMEVGGDSYDRIADITRVLIFLLSRIELTEQERNILAPLLSHTKSVAELADIFNREHHIQKYVEHVKADPEGYLNEDPYIFY